MKQDLVSSAQRKAGALILVTRLMIAALVAAPVIGIGLVSKAEAQSYRFATITIEGNQRIEDGTILSYAKLPRNQSISAGALNAAYQRVNNSGLFETVEFAPGGGRLVIRVQEWPTVNRVNIEGNKKLKDDFLLGLLRTQPRRVYSPTTAEQDAARLTEAYQNNGRLAVVITPQIIRRSNNRVDVVYSVQEGQIVENERVSFVGNRQYSDRRLRSVVDTKQAGLIRRIIKRDTFISERIAFDKSLLRDFYLARGYVDFVTLDVTSELARDRSGTVITFRVREGQQFRFGETTAVSEIPGLNANEFLGESRVKKGRVYTPTAVAVSVEKMERLALRKGLRFVQIEPVIIRDDRNLVLNIEYRITRGERIFVERIDIEGNQTTLDRVIRREFHTVEGDPFNPREIRESASRIRALNFFSVAEVNSREGSTSEQVIIDVDVEEAPTGSLSLGASYSADQGAALAIGFSERNFLGRGQLLSFDLQTGTDNKKLDFKFAEPYFMGRDLRFGLDAYYRSTDNDNASFDTESIGFSPSISFPVSDNGRLALRYEISQLELSDVDPKMSSMILQGEAGKEITSALGYTYSWDTRRTGIDPNTGYLLRFSQDFAGLGGDANYVKTTALAKAQTRVWNEEITVSATVEAGAIMGYSGYETRITDRFRMGSSVMRGFEANGIGPRDLDAPNMDALGGNYFAVARFEAEFPIGVPEEYGITGGLFADVGTIWSLDDTAGDIDGTGGDGAGGPVDDDANLRATVGVALHWKTPIGPLRFNFTKAVVKEDYDVERDFDLTISTQF